MIAFSATTAHYTVNFTAYALKTIKRIIKVQADICSRVLFTDRGHTRIFELHAMSVFHG